MAAPDARQRAIAELAGQWSALGARREARVFALSWWTERLLARAMADSAFRARLFRFVDVMPALRSTDDVVDHLRGEFAGTAAPWWLRAGLGPLPAAGAGGVVASVARRSVDRMARQFIIATSPTEVAAEAGRMWASGTAATVDLLGEHTVSDAEADRYAGRVLELVEALGAAAGSWPPRPRLEGEGPEAVPRASVSVKASALSPAFAPLTAGRAVDDAERRLLVVLERACELGVSVWFDVERYEQKAMTHRLFRRLLERDELASLHAGIVVQAYLLDAGDDLEALASWAKGRRVRPAVRLVKGAYWDTETVEAEARGWAAPVHTDKASTDAAYEELADTLHARHRELYAAFGSHNLRSLASAVVAGRARKIPDDAYEIQLLYGMAEPVHEAVRSAGLRLRVYAPMGELVPGMAYLVRRLLENTSNESFVRHHFAEHEDIAALLEAPRPAHGAPARRRAARRRASTPDLDHLAPYKPEPPARWHRHEVFDAFAGAVEAEFARPSRRVEASWGDVSFAGQDEIVSVDPAAPRSVVARAAACGAPEVAAAVAAAAAAAERWRRTPARERAAVLLRVAAHLRERRELLAALEVREVAKGWADADADVCEAVDYCEYYARRALVLERGGEVQSPPGEHNRLRYRGRGVAAVVAPWNFPLAIPAGMVAAAVVSGDCAVLKPAEQAPAVAAELVAAFTAAGLPEGVLCFVPGSGEVAGEALVSDPGVAVVAFTGSRSVGLSIVASAGRRDDRRRSVPRVIAEMGGKNAVVVDEDADLDQVVPAVLHSAFGFAGQKCSAASRLVVVQSVHDALLDRVVEATRSLSVAAPRHPGSQVGPVVDEEAHKRLADALARAGDAGTVVTSGIRVPADGYYVAPTVVADVDPESWLATDELFGPVLAVLRAPDFSSALALADDSDYALTAGVFTRSQRHVQQALDVLHAGNVYVNRAITGAVVGRQPFGGNRLSGVGSKAGGPDYLLQFCDLQVTSENTVRQGFASDTW